MAKRKKKKRKLSAWQRHVKDYMAAHPGLSFKEALPKAKRTYRSAGLKPATPRKRKKKSSRKGGRRKMARKKRRRTRQMTIPLAPVAGLVGLVAPAIPHIQIGDFDGAIRQLVESSTGYSMADNAWYPDRLVKGIAPIVVGLLVHKFVGGRPLNLNRTLAAAGVPFIRI